MGQSAPANAAAARPRQFRRPRRQPCRPRPRRRAPISPPRSPQRRTPPPATMMTATTGDYIARLHQLGSGLGQIGQTADDYVRAATNTFGIGDRAAAAMSSLTGVGGGDLAAQRAQTAAAEARLPRSPGRRQSDWRRAIRASRQRRRAWRWSGQFGLAGRGQRLPWRTWPRRSGSSFSRDLGGIVWGRRRHGGQYPKPICEQADVNIRPHGGGHHRSGSGATSVSGKAAAKHGLRTADQKPSLPLWR